MTNRSQWLRNKAKHDQRNVVDGKPRILKDSAEDTTWIPGMLEAIRMQSNGEGFRNTAPWLRQYGSIADVERKLRVLTRAGNLHMHAVRVNVNGRSVFSHYEWEIDNYQPDVAYAQTTKRVKDR